MTNTFEYIESEDTVISQSYDGGSGSICDIEVTEDGLFVTDCHDRHPISSYPPGSKIRIWKDDELVYARLFRSLL